MVDHRNEPPMAEVVDVLEEYLAAMQRLDRQIRALWLNLFVAWPAIIGLLIWTIYHG